METSKKRSMATARVRQYRRHANSGLAR